MINEMMNKDAESPNVSPQEQDQYDSITTAAMKVVDENMERIVSMIQSAPDVQEGVANVVVMLGERLLAEAQANGAQIDDDILMASAEEITQQLYDIIAELGLEQEISEDQVEQSLAGAIQKWMQRNPVPQEELAADFEKIRGGNGSHF